MTVDGEPYKFGNNGVFVLMLDEDPVLEKLQEVLDASRIAWAGLLLCNRLV